MDKHYLLFLRQQLSGAVLKSLVSGFILCFVYATTTAQSANNALLFVENRDGFPSNDLFVSSRLQNPFSRDGVNYNANHDLSTVRIHNKGIGKLIITDLTLSNDTSWQFVSLKGIPYDTATSLPLTINSGSFADLTVRFTATDTARRRVRILRNTLTIVSNDEKSPKAVSFSGLWQRQGEQNNEPYAREIISAFGFTTNTGFFHTDLSGGDTNVLKGDELRPSFFVRADTSFPVSVRQMSAYHGCCTFTEKMQWYLKGTSTLNTVFTHIARDGQTFLPRRGRPDIAAAGVFSPSGAFGLKVGSHDNTDASKNPGGRTGIRVWKAYDANRRIIPNSYIISNDYLGNEATNYDYNDNTYFIKNVRPETGRAYYSALTTTPSALDFGEKLLNSTDSLTLNLSSLGQIYSDSLRDPAINISSVRIVGENRSEFSASMPVKTTLNPQESTTLTVLFKPRSQGLKIADLLINYNNSQSPLRVPLYGIAKAAQTTVTANYRIKSGSSTPITINGKTWGADNEYAFDNLEPYTNNRLTQIAGTDEDSLYLVEQSSDADKRPFRYEFPVANGNYVVRLHFAEIYWGSPGSGLNGGAGSRVLNVSLEDSLRLVNFDVTQEVGPATALVKNIPVTVTDGKLNIDFSANVNRPMVVAVEVYSFSVLLSSEPVPDSNVLGSNNKLTKPKVFPNPTQKRFKIEFPGEYSGYSTVQLADASGRTYEIGRIRLQRGRTNNMEVDLSRWSLKPGFYYLKILYETRANDVIKLIVR